MSLDARLDALRSRHASLEQELERENQRPHPDDSRVAELKREKLRLKDEIERVNHRVEA
ncbi:MAG: DUF465 domain-containing protein [Desulfuromonadales bacterium]|nr:DUF465 domain-containing protein [Desulfuromonadales bacterium]